MLLKDGKGCPEAGCCWVSMGSMWQIEDLVRHMQERACAWAVSCHKTETYSAVAEAS